MRILCRRWCTENLQGSCGGWSEGLYWVTVLPVSESSFILLDISLEWRPLSHILYSLHRGHLEADTNYTEGMANLSCKHDLKHVTWHLKLEPTSQLELYWGAMANGTSKGTMNMRIIWREGNFVTRGQEQSEFCMPFFTAGCWKVVLFITILIFASSNHLRTIFFLLSGPVAQKNFPHWWCNLYSVLTRLTTDTFEGLLDPPFLSEQGLRLIFWRSKHRLLRI